MEIDMETVQRLADDHEFATKYLYLLVDTFAATGNLKHLQDGIHLIELAKEL